MITLLSRTDCRFGSIIVSLLLGLILALWPKPSFSQTVASPEQAGSVRRNRQGIGSGGRDGDRRNSQQRRRTPYAMCSYSSAILGLWSNEFHPGQGQPERSFLPNDDPER